MSVTGVWWRIIRGGGDPFAWTPDAADGRWQTASVVRGFYLADTEDTAWAEWYRHTSELGVPPADRMPRDTWRIRVDLGDVADIGGPGVLDRHGISEPLPTRRQWAQTQPVGDAYFDAGCRGVLAPSAAHVGGRVLAVFRPLPVLPGLTTVPPPNHHVELPPIPAGLRT